jgi:phospholipid/cholesterol/gamma-HCH transport system ATP-binding protein
LVYQYMHQRPDGPVRFHYPAVDLKEDFGVA